MARLTWSIGIDDVTHNAARQRLTGVRRWVIKVGSALLTNDGLGLDPQVMTTLTRQLASLHALGHEVVLVSSGAIAAGLVRLNLAERPREVHLSQAAAAVGQSALVRAYEDCSRATWCDHGTNFIKPCRCSRA